MPPKKNKNAKKAGRFQAEEPEVEERVQDVEDEDIEYDSDGNEIVKAKPAEDNDASSSAPGKLSAREIQKLKKKKQKGQLTEEELTKYAEYLGVEERYVLCPFVLLFPVLYRGIFHHFAIQSTLCYFYNRFLSVYPGRKCCCAWLFAHFVFCKKTSALRLQSPILTFSCL